MKLLVTGTLLGAAIVAFTPLAANASTFHFTSTLNGAQDNAITPATGTLTGTLNGEAGSWVFDYVVNYSGLQSNLVAAHIHNAPLGINGPVVHFPSNLVTGNTAGTITGIWRFNDAVRPLTDSLAQALLNSNTYFNIHTRTFPGGEIRGQIQAVPEPPTALGLLALMAWGVSWQLKNRQAKQNLAS